MDSAVSNTQLDLFEQVPDSSKIGGGVIWLALDTMNGWRSNVATLERWAARTAGKRRKRHVRLCLFEFFPNVRWVTRMIILHMMKEKLDDLFSLYFHLWLSWLSVWPGRSTDTWKEQLRSNTTDSSLSAKGTCVGAPTSMSWSSKI